MSEDVLARQAAAGPAAFDLRRFEPVLLEELAEARADPARFDRAWLSLGRRRGRRRRCWPGLLGRSSRGALDLELRERAADRDRLARRDLDADQLALDRRGDLGVDLVCHHLDDGLVAAHHIAFLLEPAVDRALGDRFAELRHLERGQSHSAVIPRWILVAAGGPDGSAPGTTI